MSSPSVLMKVNPLHIAELRDLVLPAFHAAFFGRFYSDVDLTRNTERARKFVEACEWDGLLCRAGVRIVCLRVAGDLDFLDVFWHSLSGMVIPTLLGRLAKVVGASLSSQSIASIKIVNRRDFVRAFDQLEADVNKLIRACLGVQEVEVQGAFACWFAAVLPPSPVNDWCGVEIEHDIFSAPPPPQYRLLTLTMRLAELVMRSVRLVQRPTPYILAVQISTYDMPEGEAPDVLPWVPVILIGRLSALRDGVSLAGFNIGTLDFGPQFATHFWRDGSTDDERARWALLAAYAAEHANALKMRLVFPGIDIKMHQDEELPSVGLEEMVLRAYDDEYDAEKLAQEAALEADDDEVSGSDEGRPDDE